MGRSRISVDGKGMSMNKELLTAILAWSDDEDLGLAEEPLTPPLIV